MVLAGPRVYFAMARDGLFPRRRGRVHPRFRTPTPAIVAQGVWSGVLVLCGTLSELVSYTGFAIVLFSGVRGGGGVRPAPSEPGRAAAVPAWGYPWAPAVFVAASAVIVFTRLRGIRGTSAAGLAVIAAGVPVYCGCDAAAAQRA